MKKIFSYTIPNTGTRFMNNIFREGIDDLVFIGDLHIRQRGRKNIRLDSLPCEGICPAWWERNVLSYATNEELAKIILFHTHHGEIESEIISSLRNKKPDTKVISSIRNPLLVINTSIWTHYSLKGIHLQNTSIEERKARAHYVANMMENILSIPQEHIFLFPTDLIQSQAPQERLQKVQELVGYCEMPMTKKIESLALQWNVVGDTAKTKRLRAKNKGRDITRFKNIIQSNNLDKINSILDVEISCLKNHKRLKDRLEDIGYSICW
jgi:hypothetical protein